MRSYSEILGLLFLFGCSFAPVKKVEIRSAPSGAAIRTKSGKSLGATPLALTGVSLEESSNDGMLSITLSLPGYAERDVLLQIHGDDVHEVKLTKLDSSYFTKNILEAFMPDANRMARDLLTIHGLVLAKRVDEAKSALKDFQTTFPNIASGYVLSANIALLNGDLQNAKKDLERALSLDPNDPVAARMLNSDR